MFIDMLLVMPFGIVMKIDKWEYTFSIESFKNVVCSLKTMGTRTIDKMRLTVPKKIAMCDNVIAPIMRMSTPAFSLSAKKKKMAYTFAKRVLLTRRVVIFIYAIEGRFNGYPLPLA